MPTQPALTIVGEALQRKVQQLKFGIEAPWKEGMQLFNAKAETVDSLRTFKSLFESSRCLVVADVFYEWKRDGKDKNPMHFL